MLTWRRIREHNWNPLIEAIAICILLLGIILCCAMLEQAARTQNTLREYQEAALKKAAVTEKAILRCLNGGAVFATTEDELYFCYTKVIPFKKI
jgi:hypothetical protein